ncbi:MAG: hypothetical protein ABFS35_09440 [Bacteroidota bacterium]
MKVYILAFIFISSILGCDSNNDLNRQIDKKDLIGKWVNTSLDSDTLFWYDTTINRPPKHSYTYTLNKDYIVIKYTGEYYIEVFESSLRISLNNDKSVLTIEGFDNYFPKYEGTEFKKIISKK